MTSEKRVSKRHGRLENFLQKQLPQEYSRVSWFEPCVVVNENGKPAFSFVVVTDEHLYVIGNPPRQIQTSVHLTSISSIDIVNDFPEFLSGTDREQAQHIRIVFRPNDEKNNLSTSVFDSGRSSSQGSRSSSQASQSSGQASRAGSSARSISVLSEATSTYNDQSDIQAKDGSDSKKTNCILGRRRRLRKLLLTLPLKIRDKFQSFSGQSSPNITTPTMEDEESHQSHDSGIGSDISNGEDVTSFSPPPEFLFRSPSPWQHPKKDADVFNFTLSVPLSQSSLKSPSSPYLRSPISPCSSESYTLTPVFPRSPGSSIPETPSSLMSDDDVLSGLLQLPTSTHTVQVQSNIRSQTALGNYADHKARPQSLSPSLRHGTPIDENDRQSDFANAKHADTQVKSSNLHVYVLTPQCPLFRFLVYSWNGLLIRSTMQMDTLNLPSATNGPKERYEKVFDDLQRHLMVSNDNDIAKTRQQMESVYKDIQLSPVAKRMFWKSPILFPTMVDKLRSLLGAPENRHEKQTIGLTMDKFKLCSVLLNILDVFLQGGDGSSSRSTHLSNKNARTTRDLLLGLVAMPWTPLAYRDVILDVVTSHRRLSSPDWELFQEAPLIRSLLEITHCSASALYNIMQIAYQGREMTGRQQSFGMPWIIKVITEVKQWEVYVSRLMTQVLALSTPTGPSILTPIESVQLHQKLYVIYLMANHSPLCDIQFRLNYAEDVRYFILKKVISQKTPQEYPIRQSLLQLVESIRRHVLGKQPIAQCSVPIHVTT